MGDDPTSQLLLRKARALAVPAVVTSFVREAGSPTEEEVRLELNQIEKELRGVAQLPQREFKDKGTSTSEDNPPEETTPNSEIPASSSTPQSSGGINAFGTNTAGAPQPEFEEVTESELYARRRQRGGKIYIVISPPDARGVWLERFTAIRAVWPGVVGEQVTSVREGLRAFQRESEEQGSVRLRPCY